MDLGIALDNFLPFFPVELGAIVSNRIHSLRFPPNASSQYVWKIGQDVSGNSGGAARENNDRI